MSWVNPFARRPAAALLAAAALAAAAATLASRDLTARHSAQEGSAPRACPRGACGAPPLAGSYAARAPALRLRARLARRGPGRSATRLVAVLPAASAASVDGSAPADGARGPAGTPGAPGGEGVAGQEGEEGEPGAEGAHGAAGEAGGKGDTGAAGAEGREGPQGLEGAEGKHGVRGKPGPEGPPGPSPSYISVTGPDVAGTLVFGATVEATASCPEDAPKAVGGGGVATGVGMILSTSRPTPAPPAQPSGWAVVAEQVDASGETAGVVHAFAICAS
jgi:hypothetical protein